jgi:succinate dehydrogenase hydrophobic anchor subunit
MIIEPLKTKKRTKWFFMKVTFVVLVLLWLGLMSLAVLMMDNEYKKRIKALETEVEKIRSAL